MSIYIPDFVQNLVPYRSGNQTNNNTDREAFKKLINLASKENQLGASPLAIECIERAAKELAIYPDTKSTDLVSAMAKKINRKETEIVFGHGSDSLIGYIINTFSNERDEVLTSEGTFIGIYVNTNKQGRKLVTVPLKNHALDLEAIAKAVTESTRIIYLANANNPTGTMFTADEFEAFMKNVPSNKLVILDEAYHLYSYDKPGYPDGLSYRYDNLLVLQTFSKSYGLAGLRVGYCFGPENLIQHLYKVKLPFEPNNLAQAAALGALHDDNFLKQTKELNHKMLAKMLAKFDSMGISYAPPAANFVMILMESEDMANKFVFESLKRGIVTRGLTGFKIPNGVRISTGTEEQTDKALAVFDEVIKMIKN